MSLRSKTSFRLDGASGALWASAMVILALIIVQAGDSMSGGRRAHAQAVSQAGELTTINVTASEEEDVLVVLDARRDRLSVYGVVGRNNLELWKVYELPRVFIEARAAAGLPPRR